VVNGITEVPLVQVICVGLALGLAAHATPAGTPPAPGDAINEIGVKE